MEGEGVGFKQLLKAIGEIPNLKFIISCRSSSLNLIELKFFHAINYEKIEIPSLTNEEINLLATQLPAIDKIKRNARITSLIRIPKNLDYAVKSISGTTEDFSQISEVDFTDKLWSIIVENKINENLDGLPIRRKNLFIELAVKRSKKMLPFVPLENADPVVLSKMVNENVIVKSINNDTYAPAHDVLEDWALIRYVNDQFDKIENDNDFFISLGTEPAMRRAYRLWVQNALKHENSSAIDFFTRNIKNSQLDRFWQDESLIAVLNSEYCRSFFQKNIESLKENEWGLFFRIIHIMRTACKENSSTSKDRKLLIPTGYGWQVVISIIHESIREIPSKYFDFIFYLILDWSRIIFSSTELPVATREAGLVALHLLNNHFNKKSNYPYDDKEVEKCINLIFDLCGGITQEVTEMLNNARVACEEEETDEDWKIKRYHNKVLELALSDLKSIQLAKYLPDLLISIAKEKWYRKPPKPSKRKEGFSFPISDHSWDDVNYHFGLTKKFDLDYHPSSAFQTPILWLLRNHPLKALDFITELVNYSTEKYLMSEFSKDDGCIDVELTLYNGSKITQHGSVVLWCMYRGTAKVTPYLLQSVLMAMEFYLLEVAEWGDDYKEYLQGLLDILYIKSKSIAITAVISSVCQAYPLMVGDKLLPLFTNRILFSWDISRFTHDFHPFNLRSDKEIFDNERLKSDKLPHRLKYTPGLKGFIVDYCFNIQALNDKIFEILDVLRKEASPDDLEWRKVLDDIDIRTWKVTNTEVTGDGKATIQIAPSYSDDIQNFVEGSVKPIEESHKNASYKVWLLDVEKNKKSVDLKYWQEIFIYYKSVREYSFHEHTPGLLAAVGIRDLWNHLNPEEKTWCINTTLEILNKIIGNQYKPYNISLNMSPFDDDAVLSIAPMLLTFEELKGDEENIEKLFITLLTTHFQSNDPAYTKFLKACDNTLWNLSPDKALKYFKGLIAFSQFTKLNRFYIDHPHTKEEADQHFGKLDTLIDNIYKDEIDLEIDSINFKEYSKWILQKAILFTPKLNTPPQCISFIKKIIELYIESEGEKRRDYDNDLRLHEIRIVLREKVSNIIFWSIDTVGSELFQYFLDLVHNEKIITKTLYKNNELFLFFRSTIENLILIADYNLPQDEPEKIKNTVELFEKVWKKFEQMLSEKKLPLFTDLLLLNISWNDAAVSWRPIENLSSFFEAIIKKYGLSQMQAVINLLSHIGDKTLMPRGINLIVILIKESHSKFLLSYKHSEKFVLRCYDSHLTEIKSNKELLANYLWILDEMIDSGSSEAYWIREFLISFR